MLICLSKLFSEELEVEFAESVGFFLESLSNCLMIKYLFVWFSNEPEREWLSETCSVCVSVYANWPFLPDRVFRRQGQKGVVLLSDLLRKTNQ